MEINFLDANQIDIPSFKTVHQVIYGLTSKAESQMQPYNNIHEGLVNWYNLNVLSNGLKPRVGSVQGNVNM